MITFHSPSDPGVVLAELNFCSEMTRQAVWIDVFEPTPAEEQALENALGLDVPTREEMKAIELSSRLYKEGDVLFMTATVLTGADTSSPSSSAVTFILTPERLISLRYTKALPFEAFRAEREKNLSDYSTGNDVLVGLIDAVVERIADILESVGEKLDRVSLEIFDPASFEGNGANSASTGRAPKLPQRDFIRILRRIGCISDLVSRTRESLVSFGRLVPFFRETHKESPSARNALNHAKTVASDLSSLGDHATFLSGKVSFLLDATLGMINNEQNGIIKIVSVAAVVFLPPTLVGTVYGMNFHLMPELNWALGYPFAIFLMTVSAVLPYWFFKRKNWL